MGLDRAPGATELRDAGDADKATMPVFVTKGFGDLGRYAEMRGALEARDEFLASRSAGRVPNLCAVIFGAVTLPTGATRVAAAA
jgi:hypothetical protein